MKASNRVAVVVSAVNMWRLLPGMRAFVESGQDFWLVDIYREPRELGEQLRAWKPAGIITEWLPEITEALIGMGYPTVVATRNMPRGPVGSVDVDDEAIGAIVAEYFVARGYRNLAFFGRETPYSREREAGWRRALEAAGHGYARYIDESGSRRQYIEHWHESDVDVIGWLEGLPKPVAVFAAHDPAGRMLAETCRDAGLRVPGEVAIVGVNDDELVCMMTNPPLSSVRVPWTKIGFECARLINEMIAHPRRRDWQPVIVPPEPVVTRASSDRFAVGHPRVAEALALIRDHACDGLNVKELARRCTVSRRTLEQEFRRHTGRSLREEILRTRLDRARTLLARTDLSMPMIAERCGFSSAEIFSVNFSKAQGMPPARYRRAFRLESPRG